MNHCLEDASTIENNKLISEKENAMTNTANISINCISPATSSNESDSSEENDVLPADDNMRV
jgi:hypothetical protein